MDRLNPYNTAKCRVATPRSPPSYSTESGIALLEILVAFSLGILFISLFSQVYFSTLKFKLSGEATVEARSIESVLDGYLTRIIRDYDSHPLLLTPIIHDRGRLRFVNGADNPVMFGPERLQPDSQSTAITILAPNFDSAMVVQPTSEPESSSLQGCNHSGTPLDTELVRSIIALSIDGIWEARVAAISQLGPEGCYNFNLISEQGMSLPGPPARAFPFIRRIIPIREHYTVYLGRDGELRYLGHAGAINIENQPIVSGLTTFRAEYLNGAPQGVLGLALSGGTARRSVYKAALSHFNKIRYEELLLNWLP